MDISVSLLIVCDLSLLSLYHTLMPRYQRCSHSKIYSTDKTKTQLYGSLALQGFEQMMSLVKTYSFSMRSLTHAHTLIHYYEKSDSINRSTLGTHTSSSNAGLQVFLHSTACCPPADHWIVARLCSVTARVC